VRYYYHPCHPTAASALPCSTCSCDRRAPRRRPSRGEQLRPDFLAINPNGKVPALVDGGRAIWESNAIIIYLAEREDSDLWPAGERRLDILRWMFWSRGT